MVKKPSASEKKKKEEEERKRIEEEEARIKAEQEEKERQIKEREERQLRKKTEKAELKKRISELNETRELLQEHRIRLEQLEAERRNEYAWKRYFRCDGSPNPSIEKEVNTFMSLWRMDETRLTMEEVMDESVHSLRLIDELRTLVADVGDNEEETLMTYRRTMHELRQLVQEKLDRATIETLSRAVHFADHETSNLQKTWRNDWISICIWGNLSKNPRIRQFTFPDVDITFDIPKPLTLSDCSFLISFMKFDNYSVECSSFTPHKLQKKVVLPTPPNLVHATEAGPRSITEFPETDAVDMTTIDDEDHQDLMTDLQKFGLVDEAEEHVMEMEEIIEPPIEDLVPTPEPDEWERANLCQDAVDLGEYHVIGGVIRFDLLTLPRQPKAGRGWTITTCVRPPKLTPFEYVVDSTHKTSQISAAQEATVSGATGSGSGTSKDDRKEEKPPVQVKFKLPLCLVIAEEPLLARWDPEVNQWRKSGIELEHFKEDENLVVMRTSVFGTMAIFQDFHINMPFQAWELRPLPLRPSQIIKQVVQSTSVNTNDYYTTSGLAEPVTSTFSAPVHRLHTATNRPNPMQSEPMKEAGQTASAVDATATEPSREPPPSEIPEQVMILGPVPTLGLSDETYLSELPETNQCILTITSGLTELRLHILGERIAVLPSLPEQKDYSEIGDNAIPTTSSGAGAGPVGTGGGTPGTGGGGGGGSGGAATNEAESVNADVPNHHKRELTHLFGRWFTPDELITVLQLSGVNMFPREDSVCRVECLDKNPITEQRLYEQMALLSPAIAFGWSRWNGECGDRDTIIVTAVEHVDQEHTVDEDSWGVYAMTRKKVTKLKMKEYDETFDKTVDSKQEFHADFYHMFMDTGSEEAKRRIRKIDLKYLKTVKQILQATRLVVFS